MLDLRNEPMILKAPAFDSTYVSLMVTGYDHYVNIPMSTRQGDFSEPSEILFYTARTPGYAGEAVEGVEKIAEMSGDFVSAIYRVMPHGNEPERLQRNLDAMQNTLPSIPMMRSTRSFWPFTSRSESHQGVTLIRPVSRRSTVRDSGLLPNA
jgi:hypothetical protein